MITLEDAVEIRILKKQGKSIRKIVEETGKARNTVRKYLKNDSVPYYKKRAIKDSKLDAYKPYLIKRVDEAKPHRIPAPVLMREIKEQGYKGQITILRMFLQNLQPKEKKIVQRYETMPGEQMQIDWTIIRRGKNPLIAFIAILGYSRKAYAEFTRSEDAFTLLHCHQNAFEFFGGVPEKGLYDNMKTVVTQRDKYGKGKHGFQSAFLDFSKHYGFCPKLCRPYRPQTKGKIERFGGYLKRSFYYPLETREKKELKLDDLNYEVKKWLIEVADLRFHRERKTTPQELFAIEKEYLQSLPPTYCGMRQQTHTESFDQHPLDLYEKIGGY